MWKNLYAPETIGSENGIILIDEEYKDSCRITVEKCKDYFAITCGVYGGMVHTTFTDASHHKAIYISMTKDSQEFLDKDLSIEDEELFYDKFIAQY